MAAKEMSALVLDLLEGILQPTYEKGHPRTRSFVYVVFEQILFDLSRREVSDNALDKHIASHFDTSHATDMIGRKLLTTNAFKAPITSFIQRRAG